MVQAYLKSPNGVCFLRHECGLAWSIHWVFDLCLYFATTHSKATILLNEGVFISFSWRFVYNYIENQQWKGKKSPSWVYLGKECIRRKEKRQALLWGAAEKWLFFDKQLRLKYGHHGAKWLNPPLLPLWSDTFSYRIWYLKCYNR